MSNVKPNNDLLSILKSKNEKLLRDHSYFDRTDTVSIASIQSSIFDLDSSLTSQNMENLKHDRKITKEKVKHPFKARSFKFKDRVPENWLYANPNHRITENKNPDNTIEWMRTVFDENEVIPQSCKSNLTQTLSKSHANLMSINNCSEFVRDEPQLISYQSVSDLKNLEISNKLQISKIDDIEPIPFSMTESKTAPGSIETVAEFRSSFQDFMALARMQEEKLKAEVLKRKSEFHGPRNSASTTINARQSPSVRYIKNNRKSAPLINRFGFQDFNAVSSQPRVTTRFSKPANISSNAMKPRLSLTNTNDIPMNHLAGGNFRQSADYKTRLKLYHV